MPSLRIENTVRDFDAWKAVYDKFERFRVDKGMRAYRMARQALVKLLARSATSSTEIPGL